MTVYEDGRLAIVAVRKDHRGLLMRVMSASRYVAVSESWGHVWTEIAEASIWMASAHWRCHLDEQTG